jgi:AAA domain
MSTATLEDVRSASLEALAELWDGEDEDDRAAALAEAARRDRAEQRKRARDAERAEWELAAHAQYIDADRACQGNLLSRRGIAAGITERDLWSGPAARAWTYASEELREYWEANPRVPTVTAWRAAHADDRRAERTEAQRERLEDVTAAEPEVTEPDPAAEPITETPAQTTDSPRRYPMTSFAAIVPSAPAWLWPGRIPAGEVTLLAGPCGVGKSFVTADIAGRVSRGDPMPGEVDGQAPGSVILVSAEDDASSATSWRLRAARADLGKVHDMTLLEDGEPFELPDSLPVLRRAIDLVGDVRLVVLDPLAALAAVPISSNVTVRRAIITPLRALARDTGAAIVLIHHVTKSGKVAGSQGLMDGLRQVLTVTKSEDDPRVRMLHSEKSNLAADDLPDVRYVIRGDWPDTGIAWQLQDAAGPAQQRILTTVNSASGPLGLQAISTRSGVPYDSARVLVGRMVKQGLLSRTGWGTYTAAGTAQSRALSAITPEPTRADTPAR